MTARWRQRLEAYGWYAVAVHISVQVLSITTFTLLIHAGVASQVEWMASRLPEESAGSWLVSLGAGYVLSKALFVPRVGLTLVLTPLVARVFGHIPGEGAEA